MGLDGPVKEGQWDKGICQTQEKSEFLVDCQD